MPLLARAKTLGFPTRVVKKCHLPPQSQCQAAGSVPLFRWSPYPAHCRLISGARLLIRS